MKILQTIAGFGAKSGGTSTCTYDLLCGLNDIGVDTDILTVSIKDSSDKIMGLGEYWIKTVANDCITPYGFSKNIDAFLNSSDYDLYHTNGLWMHANHSTCAIARSKKKPYIITPHGMLYPQALSRSAWKKMLFMQLCFKKDLQKASVIHATCEDEMIHYRNLGFSNPVAIIPNPAPIPNLLFANDIDRSVRRIGFIGRLHPRKNVERLLRAWVLLGGKATEAELVIMGKGDDEYERQLKLFVEQHKLKNVKFIGFVTGEEKYRQLSQLTALCVPSDFENFGMIVTEALSVNTPVIASKGTPWRTLEEENCGWWVDNDVETLAATIETALMLPEDERQAMGQRGHKMVIERFSIEKVSAQMKQLYQWILEGGELPEFVYI